MTAMDKANQILAALAGVKDTNGTTVTSTLDSGKALAMFPGVIVAVPELDWTNTPFGTFEPSDATFHIYVVAKADGFALASLEAAVVPVLRALWSVQDLVVAPNAVPGTFNSGGTDLPCYIIVCEASL